MPTRQITQTGIEYISGAVDELFVGMMLAFHVAFLNWTCSWMRVTGGYRPTTAVGVDIPEAAILYIALFSRFSLAYNKFASVLPCKET